MNREELVIKHAKEIRDFCREIKHCLEDKCPFKAGDVCIFEINGGQLPEDWELERLEASKKQLQIDQLEKFAQWIARETFDERPLWKINDDAFAEIACRKLARLGIVRARGSEWELVIHESEEDKHDT